jgi:hypothetical protein
MKDLDATYGARLKDLDATYGAGAPSPVDPPAAHPPRHPQPAALCKPLGKQAKGGGVSPDLYPGLSSAARTHARTHATHPARHATAFSLCAVSPPPSLPLPPRSLHPSLHPSSLPKIRSYLGARTLPLPLHSLNDIAPCSARTSNFLFMGLARTTGTNTLLAVACLKCSCRCLVTPFQVAADVAGDIVLS